MIGIKYNEPPFRRLDWNVLGAELLFDGCYVRSLQTLGTLLYREFDLLAFLKLTIALHLDGGKMDENVLAVFAANETIPLGGVEPLNGPNETF